METSIRVHQRGYEGYTSSGFFVCHPLLGIPPFRLLSVPKNTIPAGAEFGIRVSGDSMMPTYCDGQIVWIQQCQTLNPGEVGIFIYDGEGYIKSYEEQEPEDREAFTDSYGISSERFTK